jgi:hypothetical protein
MIPVRNATKKLKRITINYSFIPANESERKTGKIHFVSDGVQYFFNAQHLMQKLDKSTRAFYDYLCEKMNDENKVTINAALKLTFVTHYSSLTSGRKVIALSSLSIYVSKLNTLGLIIRIGNPRSGFYCVSPKYVFKGSKANRARLLAKLINIRGTAGLSLHGLINTPEAEL